MKTAIVSIVCCGLLALSATATQSVFNIFEPVQGNYFQPTLRNLKVDTIKKVISEIEISDCESIEQEDFSIEDTSITPNPIKLGEPFSLAIKGSFNIDAQVDGMTV